MPVMITLINISGEIQRRGFAPAVSLQFLLLYLMRVNNLVLLQLPARTVEVFRVLQLSSVGEWRSRRAVNTHFIAGSNPAAGANG